MPITICMDCGVEFFASRSNTKVCITCMDVRSRRSRHPVIEYYSVTNCPKINCLHIMTRTELIDKIKEGKIPEGTIVERQDEELFTFDGEKLVPNGIYQMELEI